LAVQDEWQFATDWHLTTAYATITIPISAIPLTPERPGLDIDPKLTGKILYGQAYRAPSFLEQYQKNSRYLSAIHH